MRPMRLRLIEVKKREVRLPKERVAHGDALKVQSEIKENRVTTHCEKFVHL